MLTTTTKKIKIRRDETKILNSPLVTDDIEAVIKSDKYHYVEFQCN